MTVSSGNQEVEEDGKKIGDWELSTIIVAVVCGLVIITLIIAIICVRMKIKKKGSNDHEMK